MKVFNPLQFQGNTNKSHYFEGWYYKNVSANLNEVYSFIPGISLTKNNKHAFIQIINGISGETWNVDYPLETFRAFKNPFKICIGDSCFSANGFDLKIQDEKINIYGKIEFSNRIKYPSTLFSPGIMGWYSFVPFMECKHGIGSVKHLLHGELVIDGKIIDLNGGKGYIEKDWGTSFPESWIWLHCNTFEEPDCSFTFSVAKIPWLGSFFMGHICFLYLKGKLYLFATYTGSKIPDLKYDNPNLEISLVNKTHLLKIQAKQNRSGNLKAPKIGEMNRIIKESVDSEIEIQLFDKSGNLHFSSVGKRAGLEIIEKIFSYF